MEVLEAQAMSIFPSYTQSAQSSLKDMELIESYAKGAPNLYLLLFDVRISQIVLNITIDYLFTSIVEDGKEMFIDLLIFKSDIAR